MISVRVNNLTPGGSPRRVRLFEELGALEIRPNKIKEENQMFFVIIQEMYLEKMLADDTKEKLKRADFDIMNPLEYNSMRTVIARQLDQIIDFYTEQQILEDIMRTNSWAQVESIVKLPVQSKMLKIRFKTTEMALRAIQKGLYILNQSIPAKNVEKEIFVKLRPCLNCFSYQHITKNCPNEKRNLCSFCAEEGHKFQQCNARHPKCINCGGPHKTLAARCQIRKDLIKTRSKEIREKSRSRSRARSYAEATSTRTTSAENRTTTTNVAKDLSATKEIIRTILSAISFSHYVETFKPGSFSRVMEKTLRLNGLPNIRFPVDELLDETTEAMNEMLRDIRNNQQTEGATGIDEDDNSNNQSPNMEYERDQYRKRQRESYEEPQGKQQKQKQQTAEEEEGEEEDNYPQTPSAPPSSPEDRGASVINLREQFEPKHQRQQSPQSRTYVIQPSTSAQQQQQPQQPQQQVLQQQQLQEQQNTGAMSKTTRPRLSSWSLPTLNTKDIGIKCFLYRKRGITIEMLNNPHDVTAKRYVKDQMLKGEARCTWTHPRVTPEDVKRLFEKADVKHLAEITYIMSDDIEKSRRMEAEKERKANIQTQTLKIWK